MKKCISGLFILYAILLTACAGSPPAEPATEKEVAAVVQAPEIGTPAKGKAYDINETCHVLETYETYDIQMSPEQMHKELWQEGYQDMTFKSHEVALTDDTTSEQGKYDVSDTAVVALEGADPMGILPQTMEQTVTYKRNAETQEWEKESAVCKNWKINHKKLGGTAWKMSTSDGEIYIRLRDTIEFFYTNVDPTQKSTESVDFETTILGAMATVKNGEMTLERIHILSGTLSDTGVLTVIADVYDMEKKEYKEEKKELVLNDFTQIEKSQLPFTEEEYKEVASAW